MDALCLKPGIHGMPAPSVGAAGNVDLRGNAAAVEKPCASAAPPRNLPWGFTFRHPLRSLWPGSKMRHSISVNDAVLVAAKDEVKSECGGGRANDGWVFKLLRWDSLRPEEGRNGELGEELRVKLQERENAVEQKRSCGEEIEECGVCETDDDDDDEDEDDGEIKFDRESFSKLLRKVSLAESRFYAQLSYLGCLAYSIPQIKPRNLLRYHGLQFVTSSLEKKAQMGLKIEKEKESPAQEQDIEMHQTDEEEHPNIEDRSDIASAVVGAEEEVQQAMADELSSSILSSPCDWFVCDDDQMATRFFVIQVSESLDSWKANLLFDPIQFEGLDVLVHRGIHEAAKGMYEQMLPEIHAHLISHGDHGAQLRFTGHSLGGSLSVLLNLMLLIRGDAPRSSLLPVVTYGAPSIMCGGDRLLCNLGLPRNHVQSITMHRDIVPQAFSCNYPTRVAEFLKYVNGNFRNHPCLNKQKLLYTPMGEFLILQPDDNFSPSHDLLPPGSGLYLLTGPISHSRKQTRAAQAVFLNSPHPLEILTDRSAYGSQGNVQRDHDMGSYLRSIKHVIRRELWRGGRRRALVGHARVGRPVSVISGRA